MFPASIWEKTTHNVQCATRDRVWGYKSSDVVVSGENLRRKEIPGCRSDHSLAVVLDWRRQEIDCCCRPHPCAPVWRS